MEKIYRIQYLIPKNKNKNENFILLEINTEDWKEEDFEYNLNKELNNFNKINPIPIDCIITKKLKLIYDNNEYIWKEF